MIISLKEAMEAASQVIHGFATTITTFCLYGCLLGLVLAMLLLFWLKYDD